MSHPMAKSVHAALTALAFVGISSVGELARAEEHAIDAFVAGDVWPAADPGGHGIAYLGWRWQAPFGRVHASYNTDTLTLGIDQLCLTARACFGAQVRGQFGFAGLLPDYYQGGTRIPEFGFSASYVAATLTGQIVAPQNVFIDLASTARRWFFAETDDTEQLTLPAETWVFEQRLAVTVWSFAPDPSTRDPHRPSWRLRGFGLGVAANLHHRLDAPTWGPFLGVPRVADFERNAPDRTLVFIRQWAAMGAVLAPGWRLQLTERAGWGWGEDDLTRARIGGLNPYVVPVAGLPWAAILAGRYIAGQVTLHFEAFDDVEIGPQIDVVAVRDIRRRGEDEFGVALGIGGFVDVRWGPWQVELRAGYSPDIRDWQQDTPHVSFYALAGRTFAL